MSKTENYEFVCCKIDRPKAILEFTFREILLNKLMFIINLLGSDFEENILSSI